MPKSITIRAVPEDTCDELAARAARSGRSLQEYLLAHMIDLARRPDPNELRDRVRARKHQTRSTLSTADILSHREADRR